MPLNLEIRSKQRILKILSMFLVGDNSKYPIYSGQMELWHTDDNNVEKVGNPNVAGITIGKLNSFYKPVISSFDEDSIILIGSMLTIVEFHSNSG